MAIQKFTGRVIGTPKQLETANTHRSVVHVVVDFTPDMSGVSIFGGKLPKVEDSEVNRIQLSFWDENFQKSIMSDAEALSGQMITGYCDGVTKREQFYNATGYAFVAADAKAKIAAPQITQTVQVISRPAAPVAPVAPV